MKKILLISLLVCSAFFTSSCFNNETYVPKGVIETKDLEITEFNAFDISDNIKVYVTKSTSSSVNLTTYTDVYDKVDVYSDGTTLFAKYNPQYNLTGISVSLNITCSSLDNIKLKDNVQINLKGDFVSTEDIEVVSSGNSNLLGTIRGKDLNIVSSDNSSVNLFGSYEKVTLKGSDNATIDLSDALIDSTDITASDKTKISIKSVGAINVNATDLAAINVFGGHVIIVSADTSVSINYISK